MPPAVAALSRWPPIRWLERRRRRCGYIPRKPGKAGLTGRGVFVGRAPWPAADPLVGLLEHRKSRTRGSGADGGVRPTFGCGSAALWGRRFRLPTGGYMRRNPVAILILLIFCAIEALR